MQDSYGTEGYRYGYSRIRTFILLSFYISSGNKLSLLAISWGVDRVIPGVSMNEYYGRIVSYTHVSIGKGVPMYHGGMCNRSSVSAVLGRLHAIHDWIRHSLHYYY